MTWLQTVGVAVVALRKGATQSEVLVTGDGAWEPLRSGLRAGESEAQAAQRVLGEAGIAPERLYAASLLFEGSAGDDAGRGRLGVFVAFVGPGRDAPTGDAWVSLPELEGRRGRGGFGALLEHVRARFVRATPDEALRVA